MTYYLLLENSYVLKHKFKVFWQTPFLNFSRVLISCSAQPAHQKPRNNFKKPPNKLNPCFNASSQISITLLKSKLVYYFKRENLILFKTLFVIVKNSLCIGYEFSVHVWIYVRQLKIMQECVLLPNKKRGIE